MLRRHLIPLSLSLFTLAGCPVEDDADKDTDSDTVEPVDTDDSDPIIDTEVEDTDETDVGAELTDIRSIRLNQGFWTEGDLLAIEGAIVTSVYGEGVERGFTVQSASATIYGGLWVAIGASSTLPTIGQTVDVVGTYKENDEGNPGGTAPNGTRTELVVLESNPASSWTATGTATLPDGVELTVAGFTGSAELYESMIVTLEDDPALFVVTEPDGLGGFGVRNNPLPSVVAAYIGGLFVRLDTIYAGLGIGDTFDSIEGVVYWRDNNYWIEPTASGDVTGYAVYVPPDTDDTDPEETDETDDTDIVIDTDDTDVGFGLTDTFIEGDTDEDTDDTNPPDPFLDTVIPDVRAGFLPQGRLVRVRDAIVTASRFQLVPPGSNSFVIQDPTVNPADGNAGIYVFVADDATLPNIGDKVDVIGTYEEFPSAGTPPYGTLSRLSVVPTDPLTSWTLVSTNNPLPNTVQVEVNDFASGLTIETYESMLVELVEAMPLEVTSGVLSSGDFRVSVPTTTNSVLVNDQFYDMTADFSVTTSATIQSVTGVVFHEILPYKLSPTRQTDVTNFTP